MTSRFLFCNLLKNYVGYYLKKLLIFISDQISFLLISYRLSFPEISSQVDERFLHDQPKKNLCLFKDFLRERIYPAKKTILGK